MGNSNYACTLFNPHYIFSVSDIAILSSIDCIAVTSSSLLEPNPGSIRTAAGCRVNEPRSTITRRVRPSRLIGQFAYTGKPPFYYDIERPCSTTNERSSRRREGRASGWVNTARERPAHNAARSINSEGGHCKVGVPRYGTRDGSIISKFILLRSIHSRESPHLKYIRIYSSILRLTFLKLALNG